MIGYVALALRQYIVTGNNLLSLLVHSKIVAGVTGVAIIMRSVASSIGVFSLYGIGTSKAALVVLVFIVLAVGVNRIFIFIQAYQVLSVGQSVEDRIAHICGQVMPSMLLSALTESLWFFVAIFVWDCKREKDARFQKKGKPEVMYHCKLESERVESEGYIFEFMQKYVAPRLMRKWMRMTVLVVFILWFCCSLCIFPFLNPVCMFSTLTYWRCFDFISHSLIIQNVYIFIWRLVNVSLRKILSSVREI
ncbi:hypothetical protein DICVIV_13588 [Dictyocaulus viviparus]|uniref:SSD domain-containing protein n=1 Tax=Dictyocaulus viviparus TaxID=29172 RepID=A0A0D8X7E2_DICVI|nr:hypothetical protein DICVIV_13588 [Dictyocaulus viviparus]